MFADQPRMIRTWKSGRGLFNLKEIIRIVPYGYSFSNAKFVHY
ncbi:MAG: hypothetical protein ACRDF4_03905 [Rhabdochlamydiaceae bacterium]